MGPVVGLALLAAALPLSATPAVAAPSAGPATPVATATPSGTATPSRTATPSGTTTPSGTAAPVTGSTPSGTATPSPRSTGSPSPSAPAPAPASPTPVATAGPTPRTGSAAAAADQPLVVTAAADRATVTTTNQTVAYAVVVRDAGNVAVSGLLVQAPGAGLSALVCAPVAQGGTLAAGAATTCRASRTTSLADLRQAALADTVTVTGRSGASSVTATTTVSVAVDVAPPRATDQHTWVVAHGRTVVYPGATTATPAEPGGPAIDPSLTVFPDAQFDHQKIAFGEHGIFTARPDGRIELDPYYEGGGDETVRYRVFDVLGHSTDATLTLTARTSATSSDQTVSTLQGRPVTVDPLRADRPGQELDGSSATFVRSSVRLVRDEGSFDDGTLSADGRSYAVPFVGTWTVDGAGLLTFTPDPRLTTTTPRVVAYEATDTGGSRVHGYVSVRVVPVRPKTDDESRTTTYGRATTFRAASDDTPGNPVVPIDVARTALTVPRAPGGRSPAWSPEESRTLTDRAGTWKARTDGTVAFTAASGYAGTDQVSYAAVDSNGTRSRATLTVTVQPGPVARSDAYATGQGDPVELAVLANDTPGRRADGSAGAFDVASLRFALDGQPVGATSSASRTTLVVPGQGTWSVTAGQLRFAPASGFAGGTTAVTYQSTDSQGLVSTATADVVVTSTRPAAGDDLVATPFRTAVVVDGSRDDSAGGGSAPALDYASTVFTVDGQPVGSTRAADGRTLTVPGQGTWVLASADGTATFTPATDFVGTTSPVTYSVADLAGQTDQATMRVQVRPGPQPRPDVTSLPVEQPYGVGLGVLLNDVPSRNADGTLGHTDRDSLRLAPSARQEGWTVAADGLSATTSSGFEARLEPTLGIVEVYAGRGARRGLTPRLVYTVDDLASAATGATVRRSISSYVQVRFPTVAPTATPDHGETTSPDPVRVGAARSDVPGGPGTVGLDLASVTFPSDQLRRLPPGSAISFYGITPTLTVPGQGSWTADVIPYDPYEGTVVFVPEPGFVGEADPVDYRVFDVLGTQVRSTLSVTVRPGYVGHDDAVSTPQGVPLTLDVVANDDPGQLPDGTPAPLRSGVRLLNPDGSETGEPPGDLGLVLYVTREGTYRVGYASGLVSVTPLPGFSGPATPVLLSVGGTTSTLRVDVVAAVPAARPDSASTTAGRPVVADVLANDTAGDPRVPLVGSSVRLLASAGATPPAGGRSLVVPGRGTFLVAGDGHITFVPQAGATGAVPAVTYRVADVNQTTTTATLSVQVGT